MCVYGDLARVVGAKGIGVYNGGVEVRKGELRVVLEVGLFQGDRIVMVGNNPVVGVTSVDAGGIVADNC